MLLVVGILVGLRNCINFSWANESQEIALTKVYAENKAENALWGYQHDPEGEAIAKSWEGLKPKQFCKSQVVTVPRLPDLQAESRGKLLRHFATSAKWYVHEIGNNLVVERRSILNGNWRLGEVFLELYPRYNVGAASASISIYPSGLTVDPSWGSKNYISWQSRKASLNTFIQDKKHLSITYFQAGKGLIKIWEDTPFCERKFTEKAISVINQEIENISSSQVVNQRGFDFTLMPKNSIKATLLTVSGSDRAVAIEG